MSSTGNCAPNSLVICSQVWLALRSPGSTMSNPVVATTPSIAARTSSLPMSGPGNSRLPFMPVAWQPTQLVRMKSATHTNSSSYSTAPAVSLLPLSSSPALVELLDASSLLSDEPSLCAPVLVSAGAVVADVVPLPLALVEVVVVAGP